MAILTFAQVLTTSSKRLCHIRQFWKKNCQKLKKIYFFVFLEKLKKKKFLVENFCLGHLPRKTTYGRRPDKKNHFPALPWCLCYLNITFTFTPLSSNCSIYHFPIPSIILLLLCLRPAKNMIHLRFRRKKIKSNVLIIVMI